MNPHISKNVVPHLRKTLRWSVFHVRPVGTVTEVMSPLHRLLPSVRRRKACPLWGLNSLRKQIPHLLLKTSLPTIFPIPIYTASCFRVYRSEHRVALLLSEPECPLKRLCRHLDPSGMASGGGPLGESKHP